MLRNRIVPSYFWMIPLLIQRPSPVPLLDFVLKNGSKSLFASSARIPVPVSKMEMRIPRRWLLAPEHSRTLMHRRPPSGIDSMALQIRLRNTCFNSPGNACTLPSRKIIPTCWTSLAWQWRPITRSGRLPSIVALYCGWTSIPQSKSRIYSR